MLQIMLMPLRRYADFSGRSGREEFWLFMLFTYLIALAYCAVCGVVLLLLFLAEMSESDLMTACLFLFVPWGLASLYLFVPTLAVSVRRLHDTGRSGWAILIGLIPLVGAIFLLLWYASRGSPGPNRFGPAPQDGDAAQAFA